MRIWECKFLSKMFLRGPKFGDTWVWQLTSRRLKFDSGYNSSRHARKNLQEARRKNLEAYVSGKVVPNSSTSGSVRLTSKC